jgi:hypothetical protein
MQTRLAVSERSVLATEPGFLYKKFREIFDASLLPNRAIFWFEESQDRFVLRMVRDLGRTKPFHDFLIGMVPPDIASVKRAIGNFVSGNILSLNKFELYDSFDLSNQVASGRFDFFDLNTLGSQEPKNSVLGDWDFDGLVATHRCSFCGRASNLNSVMPVLQWMCVPCGGVNNFETSLAMIKELIVKYSKSSKAVTVFKTNGTYSELPSVFNFVPTALIFWYMQHQMFHGSSGWVSSGYDYVKVINLKILPDSIFGQIENSETKQLVGNLLEKAGFGHSRDFVLNQFDLIRRYLLEQDLQKRIEFEFQIDAHFLKTEFANLYNKLLTC